MGLFGFLSALTNNQTKKPMIEITNHDAVEKGRLVAIKVKKLPITVAISPSVDINVVTILSLINIVYTYLLKR
jgi:hypothetical protein